MPFRAQRVVPLERAAPEKPAAVSANSAAATAPRETVVAPPPLVRTSIGPSQSVRDLQRIIEDAFVLLDRAADGQPGSAAADEVPAEPPAPPARAVLGAAAGSELRYRRSLSGRVFKTVAGLALVFVVGLVPLQKVLTPVSSEAFVNAPVYVVFAPADGVLTSVALDVGAHVRPGEPLAFIGASGSAAETAVTSAGDGKLWELDVRPGDIVAKGDVLARVVGCSAATVTASVTEGVYDKLSPGTPARFNFLGSDRFFHGTLANMLGQLDGAGNYAISPAKMTRGSYRVVVSLPDLDAIEDCAVGRRGAVVFGPAAR